MLLSAGIGVLVASQIVLALGNPLGLENSVSFGVVSAVARQIKQEEPMVYIQTDAPINPGNSGGPVIDVSGRLVGISSAKMAFTPQGVPTQGLGFAIPAAVVRDSVNRFKKIAQKQPEPANRPATSEASASSAERLFGMQLQNLSEQLSDALGYAQGHGVLVAAVEPDSPADEAGVQSVSKHRRGIESATQQHDGRHLLQR